MLITQGSLVRVQPDPPEQRSEWGFSSFGRASALQAEGERFESVNLHQTFCCGSVLKRRRENRYSSLRILISALADSMFFNNLEEVKKVTHANVGTGQPVVADV